MIRKTSLYIGIGGTGCHILSMIKSRFIQEYDETLPANIRFLAIDTDECEKFIINENFLHICPERITPEEYLSNERELHDWYIDDGGPMPEVGCGTASNRKHARLLLHMDAAKVFSRIRMHISELIGAGRRIGNTGVDVYLVMSLTGGTGSGICIPLAMALSQYENVRLMGYGVLDGIFRKKDVGAPVFYNAFINAYSAMMELDYLQHADLTNPITMSVANVQCTLSRELFDEFYLMEPLNAAGEVIIDRKELLNSVALSMYASSFVTEGHKGDRGFLNREYVENKRSWLGSTCAFEIVYDGAKVSELYSSQVALNSIAKMLAEHEIQVDSASFSKIFCPNGEVSFLEYLNAGLRINKSRFSLPVDTNDKATISKAISSYLVLEAFDSSVKSNFVNTVGEYIKSLQGNYSLVENYICALRRVCHDIKTTVIEELESVRQMLKHHEESLRVSTDALCRKSSFISFKVRRWEINDEVQHYAHNVKMARVDCMLREYAIETLDSVMKLLDDMQSKNAEGRSIALGMQDRLKKQIQRISFELQNDKERFVYNLSYQYWNSCVMKECDSVSVEYDRFMEHELLSYIENLPHAVKLRDLSVAEVIASLPEERYYEMLGFIDASLVGMLMLDKRGYHLYTGCGNDVVDMARSVSVTLNGDDAIRSRMAKDIEHGQSWGHYSLVALTQAENENLRGKVIIAMHEGFVIPYCIDAFAPDIVQKEYYDTKQCAHIDAGIYEAMQKVSFTLKPASLDDMTIDVVDCLESGQVDEHMKTEYFPEIPQIDRSRSVKVFIAGSKELKAERMVLREELNKVENSLDIDIRSYTFEDFSTSLKGKSGGRQSDYNKFIRDEADVVIFIFDSKAGSITEEEFTIAYESLQTNNRPDIFVYGRNMLTEDPGLQRIKQKLFDYNNEYYVEYDNIEKLRYLFSKDMMTYFMPK